MENIKTLTSQFNAKFNIDWKNTINSGEQENILLTMQEFFLPCFYYISRSLISGEYVKYINYQQIKTTQDNGDQTFKNSFTELLELITKIKTNLSDCLPEEKKEEQHLKNKFENLCEDIEKTVKLYQLFFEEIEYKFSLKGGNQTHKYRLNKPLNEYLVFFAHVVLPLCRFDYFPPITQKEIDDLINIKETIQDKSTFLPQEERFICDILLYKCNFLLQKIDLVKLSSRDLSTDQENFELNGLQDFIANEKSQEEIMTVEMIKRINSQTATYGDYINTIRYYKNSDKDDDKYKFKKLSETISLFDNQYPDKYDGIEYDIFAHCSVKMFLHTTLLTFNFKCDPNGININTIRTEIDKIKKIPPPGTEIDNYYPYYKAIKELLPDFRNKIKNASEEIEQLEQYLHSLFDDFFRSIALCENKRFFVFQLPFNESLKRIDPPKEFRLESLDVFVPSSCAKIINYTKTKNEVSELKHSVNPDLVSLLGRITQTQEKTQTLINSQEFMKKQLDTQDTEIKARLNEFQKIQRNSLKHNVELLTIFAGVITFLFGIVVEMIAVEPGIITIDFMITKLSVLGIIIVFFVSLILIISPFYISPILEETKTWKEIFNAYWSRFVSLIFIIIITIVFLWKL